MLLIMGGTRDSIQIGKKLESIGRSYIISVATEYGKKVAEASLKGSVICGRMNQEAIEDFIKQNCIHCVIDATHPFAKEVSENAIKASQMCKVNYLRFERPSIDYGKQGCFTFSNYIEALSFIDSEKGPVFVTTGANNVELICEYVKDRSRLFFRLLPQVEAIKKLNALDIHSGQIVGMKGPFDLEGNLWMFKRANAKILLTKESGQTGMVDEKIKAAHMLGMKVVVITRPIIEYPIIFDTVDALVDKVIEVI